MPFTLDETFGYLTEIQGDNETIERYSKFLNKPGAIIFRESIKKYPGKKFIYFYIDAGTEIQYFHTSCGDAEEDGDLLKFSNGDTKFTFKIDKNCLTNLQKKELMMNI